MIMENRKRIEEIDVAKGIGILLVVIGHRTLEDGGLVAQFIYSFHMPLFFILSGLVMRPSEKCRLKERVKSESKLIANYIFWSGVYILFDFVVRFMILGNITLLGVVVNVYQTCTLFGISVLWFLSTLIMGKITAGALASRIKNKLLLILVGVCMFVIISFAAERYVLMLGELHGIVRIIYYPSLMVLRSLAMSGLLLCGYAFRTMVSIVLKSKWGGCCTLALLVNVVVIPFTGSYDYHYMEIGNPIIALILAVTGFIGVLGISILVCKLSALKRAFLYLGKNSLFIMVTHEYLMLGALSGIIMALIFAGNFLWLDILCQVIVLMIVEVLLCRWVEPICNSIIHKLIAKII